MARKGERRYQTIGRRPVNEDELKILLRTCRKIRPEFEGLLLLAAESGLRVHEIAKAKWSDLSTDRIRVLGKGNVLRWTVLTRDTSEKLERLYNCSAGRDAKNRILIPDAISPVGTVRLMEWFSTELRPQAGISTAITWHCLRHRFACKMLAGGMTVKEVQILLGHSRLETTSRYLHCGEDLFYRAQIAVATNEIEPINVSPRLKIINGGAA